ncbi:MAG: acyl-CoA dehydrogenase family protein [Alphaproteobacteria bacterium]|nr:MAG: acyl-CoA dehydrogenase family protein [Alphaproteobacteria bacterium]
MQADQGPAASTLAGANAAAVNHRLAEGKVLERPSSERDAIDCVMKEIAAHGLMEIGFLDSGRNSGGDFGRLAAITETLASYSGTVASIYAVNAVFGGTCLALLGNAAQKARFLPDIKAGKCQVAFAHTEPEAGSDAAAIKTAAIRVPGGFRLNGEKIFTTGAASADYIFVVARNEAIEIKGRQVSVFMVKRNAEGLTIERLQKMSANLHASCRVVIQDVYLPEDMVLGGLEGMDGAGSGLRVLGTLERFVVAASNVGLARAATDRAIEFAKARHQFGKPIAAFQSIQHKLVEMRTLVRSMSLMVAHASDLLESGADATEQVCMAKYYCAEQLQHVVACGMRVLGGRAYFEPEDMERYYREAPLALYAGGTVEIQKHLIARCMGLPAV